METRVFTLAPTWPLPQPPAGSRHIPWSHHRSWLIDTCKSPRMTHHHPHDDSSPPTSHLIMIHRHLQDHTTFCDVRWPPAGTKDLLWAPSCMTLPVVYKPPHCTWNRAVPLCSCTHTLVSEIQGWSSPSSFFLYFFLPLFFSPRDWTWVVETTHKVAHYNSIAVSHPLENEQKLL